MVFACRPTLALLLSLAAAGSSQAELWRSPLAAKTYYEIHKQVASVESDDGSTITSFMPLPAAILSAAGKSAVDYESFLVTYVSEPGPLELALKDSDLVFTTDAERQIQFPHQVFDPLIPAERIAAGFPETFASKPVPGLYVLQFAYPPTGAWYEAFKGCGAEVLATFQSQAVLVRSPGLASLTSCANAPYLLWIDSYLTTDRVAPGMLLSENPLGYSFQFKPATNLFAKEAAMPVSIVVDESFADPETGTGFIGAMVSLPDFTGFVASDPDLLSVTWRGEAQFSDERQGQIVAGNYTAQGTVVSPGYASWLACPPKSAGAPCASLLTTAHPQTVAIFDSGYDGGAPPSPEVDHHPDLEQPERLVEIKNYSLSNGTVDILGHGTMVSGIIAGLGNPAYSHPLDPNPGAIVLKGGGKDPEGFFRGSGIAPASRLLVARMIDTTLQDTTPGTGPHERALRWARTNPDGSDRALIVNESWNQTIPIVTAGLVTDALPLNQYDQKAQFYDARVRDANTALAGLQPMTVVFAAGNQGSDHATGAIRYETLLAPGTPAIPGSLGSPATAKNVLSVGASASYRPGSDPPPGCRDDPTQGRFVGDDAPHIAAIGRFSARGGLFDRAGKPPLHQSRVKPDLVAPAIRVFSTVPFNFFPYGIGVGCAQFYPSKDSGYYYTYGSGTSFAAPVVSGAAALTRQWFLDRAPSLDPSPALIKAALVATADTLGGQVGNDHRPSPDYGWGRVNLAKIVDGRVARFALDSPTPFTTLKSFVWERTIDVTTRDTYIVLAWVDPPADITSTSPATLKNDLEIRIEESGTSPLRFWAGNNFNENRGGADNGYSFRFTSGMQPSVDKVNNVESVFIPANTLTAGRKLLIMVTAKSLVPNARQFFAVYAYNVRPNS